VLVDMLVKHRQGDDISGLLEQYRPSHFYRTLHRWVYEDIKLLFQEKELSIPNLCFMLKLRTGQPMNSSLSQLISNADILADTPVDWGKRVNVALNRRRIIDQCKSLIDWAVSSEPSKVKISVKGLEGEVEFTKERNFPSKHKYY